MCFEVNKKLEKHIRCKCGKMWGMKNFRRRGVCRRCKTPTIARGEIGYNA